MANDQSLDGSNQAGTWDPRFTRARGGRAYKDSKLPRGGNVSFRVDSPNREIIRERRDALAAAREADRNNPAIRAGITKRAVDMVGHNLRLQSMPNFEMLGLSAEWAAEFASQFEHWFSIWGTDPRKLNDAERHNTFGSMMFETVRNCYGADGEAAMIVRFSEKRRKKYRGRFATFVELVDPDRITNPNGQADSETLCQGRVLDEWGAYEALWIERRHPSDARGKREWKRVERETERGRPIAIHWFPRFRPGAQRAMPAILGSLREVRMLDTIDNKTLEAAVKAAFMSIVIKTDSTTAEALAKISAAPTDGNDPLGAWQDMRFGLYEDFQADGQAIPVMAPGDEVKVETASHANNNTDSFRFAFERKFASLLGLSYARFSNDYSKTSFASIRAEFIDSWRLTYADRYAFGNSVPTLIAMAVLEELIVTERIVLPPGAPDFYENMDLYAQCEFRGPGMGWVDPVKDIKASAMRVATGASNPIDEAAAQGTDYFDNIDQTARAQAYAMKKLGHMIDYANDGAAMADPEDEEEETPEEAAEREERERAGTTEPSNEEETEGAAA